MLKHLIISVSLIGTLTAQKTLPPGFVSTSGPSYSIYLGGYAEHRVQLATGLLKGSVTVMTSLDLRQDNQYYSNSATARSWSNVSLDLADTDFAQLDRTFANNIKSTPTNVFSASVSWGAINSRPTNSPEPWATGGRTFQLSAPYIYAGVSDLLLDFKFTGGQLLNGGSWTSLKTYYLDGETYPTSSGNSAGLYGNSTCISSLSTATIPDQHVLWIASYAKNGGTANDDTIVYYPGHAFGANSTAHIGAIGTQLLNPGINIGGCQDLYMVPVVFYPFTTSTGGGWSGPRQSVPFNSALVGSRIYAQAAHTDQGTIHLSRAGNSVVRDQPQDPKDYGMVSRSGSTTSTTGSIRQTVLPLWQIR